MLGLFLAACQSTPDSIQAELNTEFILAPGQSANISATGLTLRLIGVTGDDRCPSGVECAMSGPVTVQISVEADSFSPAEIILQTFTGKDGRAPGGQFEGIQDRIEVGGFEIRLAAVLPYPQGFGASIKERDYRVSFVVTEK